MQDVKEPKLPKWPFLLSDLLLVAAAGCIYYRSILPLGVWPCAAIVLCVGAGAFLAILPFVLEYNIAARLLEAQTLTDTVSQINNVKAVADQISGATARWQGAQEVADRVAATSKAIAERMSAEAKAFTDFLQRANDNEKATLRLETEKLRRAEAEWLQVMVRMLDHIYALHMAGVKSGQPKLAAQLDQFQYACRDAARRIGLAPFTADSTEKFDAQRHQPFDGQENVPEGAIIEETVATGYTFQGRMLRPAIVRLQGANGNGSAPGNLPERDTQQPQLPLTQPKDA